MTNPVTPFVPRRLARVATDALRLASTYLLGEPVIGMDPTVPQHIGRLFMGDGVTLGGLPHALLAELTAEVARAEAAEAALTAALSAGLSAVPGLLTPPSGRLTLTSGTAITSTDNTGASSIYYTGATTIPLFNGALWIGYRTGELSMPFDPNSGDAGYHLTGGNFDVFAFLLNGAVVIGTGPYWTSATARGTGAGTTQIALLNGLWTNANAITLRYGLGAGATANVPVNQALYLGTQRMVGNGLACDTFRQRYLYNAYNQVRRPVRVTEPADNWLYSQPQYRQVNGNALNQVEIMLGLGGVPVSLRALSTASNSTAAYTTPSVGIGLDSTTVDSSNTRSFNSVGSQPLSGLAEYDDFPGLGFHVLPWLECGDNSQSTQQTWFGTKGGVRTQHKPGLTGGFFG